MQERSAEKTAPLAEFGEVESGDHVLVVGGEDFGRGRRGGDIPGVEFKVDLCAPQLAGRLVAAVASVKGLPIRRSRLEPSIVLRKSESEVPPEVIWAITNALRFVA